MEVVPLTSFEESLFSIGNQFYHDKHPFHRRMYLGKLSRHEIRGWVANRFYYQIRIPIKDSIILSKADDIELRKEWIHRITDHDGDAQNKGGIKLWLELADAVGLSQEEVEEQKFLTAKAKAAVGRYVEFVSSHPLFDCIASSLTELFAVDIHQSRLDSWVRHYPWVKKEGYRYFQNRVVLAPKDVRWTLNFIKEYAINDDLRERTRNALFYKCHLLWDLIAAIEEEFSPEIYAWQPYCPEPAQLTWEVFPISYIRTLLENEEGVKLASSVLIDKLQGKLTRWEIIHDLKKMFPDANGNKIKISATILLNQMFEAGHLI